MDFNYFEEEHRLMLANNSIQKVINDYTLLLMDLDSKEKNIIQLYYYLKQLDTICNMTPKGIRIDSDKTSKIENSKRSIIKYGNKIYPNIIDIDKLRVAVMNDMDGKLLDIINCFTENIKEAYKKYSKYVYTVLPISGLSQLIASKHRENQYRNEIIDGIYSTTSFEGIKRYIARANVGSMIAHGNEIEYPTNPFSSINDNELTLVKPVSIYLSDIDYFVPQINYEVDKDGNAYFIFDGEWVAPQERIPCIERQTSYLPSSFIKDNNVYYYTNGEKKLITSNTIKL